MKKLFLAAVMMMGLSTVSFAQSNFSADAYGMEMSDQQGTPSIETLRMYDNYTFNIYDYIHKKGTNRITKHLRLLLNTYRTTDNPRFMEKAITFYQRFKNAEPDYSKLSKFGQTVDDRYGMGAAIQQDCLEIEYALTGNDFIDMGGDR